MRAEPRKFSITDHETWRAILLQHEVKRSSQICDIFLKGVNTLKLTAERIPDLNEVNKTLEKISGFKGVYVEGLEEGASFFKMLSRREFPVGNFVRDRRDLSYTPAPDVVHDLYGHLPFFTDKAYSDFWQKLGEAACEFESRPELLRQFERFYWFTAEFGLIKTPQGMRIFGAGIASSVGECAYALSGTPEVLPFDIEAIRTQEFRIDQMQPRLFCLENTQQLYGCLPELVKRVRNS